MVFRIAAALIALAVPGACRDVESPGVNGSGNGSANGPAADAVVTVDTLRAFQTMTGWEAVAQAGQNLPGYANWKDDLLDKAVNELGINRLRIHLRSGSENRIDYFVRSLTGEAQDERCERWLITNDNEYPGVIDPSGFRFSEIDTAMVKVIIPIRQRLQARGEKLFLNLNYVAALDQCTTEKVNYIHANPDEYAELVLAAFQHMKNRYGFVPDALEVVLEPDNGQEWNGTSIGRAIVATANTLAAHGFRPAFIAPSNENLGSAVAWSRQMFAVAGVSGLVSEVSYHRYGGASEENLSALADLAKANGATTAMLEHIGSGVDDLYDDLTSGNASAWQQFTLGMGPKDAGGQYYRIIDNRAVMTTLTRDLRHYFRYVRFGARRVAATASGGNLRAVAFRNTNGSIAVVIHTKGSGSIEIRGLAPGRYGASATTSSDTAKELGTQTAGSSGSIVVQSPGQGMITVYRQ